MKSRLGFVSNSSSSSFIVGIKGDKLTTEIVTEALGVPPSSALYKIANDIASFVVERSSEMTVETILDDFGYDTEEEARADRYIAMRLDRLDNGFKMYTGYADRSESDNPVETLIGNGGLGDINTENFTFTSEN